MCLAIPGHVVEVVDEEKRLAKLDVAGVQRDGNVLERLDAATAETMLADGSASAGMRPKLRAALVAAAAGCEVRIVDGRSVAELERALHGEPAGTMVTAA